MAGLWRFCFGLFHTHKMNKKNYILSYMLPALALPAMAQSDTISGSAAQSDSVRPSIALQEVTVSSPDRTRRLGGAVGGQLITQRELFRAACCNLGESFTTNPSVDVSYSDAATGVKQIRLLGLSGIYVQMLTENMPAFRTAAQPFALAFVPGPWMNSIQVSKGCASVKNGYEAITGQINIDYLRPDDEPHVGVNVYGDTQTRTELNADANLRMGERWSMSVMGHADRQWDGHDGNNDGFLDQPKTRQLNVMNRWKYAGAKYIFHGGWSALTERRRGGQDTGHGHATMDTENGLYTTGVDNTRYEAYMKHAFMLDADHGTNIALMANASAQFTDAWFGQKQYADNAKNVYAQLLFDHNFSALHQLSAGASICYDYLSQRYLATPLRERETTSGAYAQYTLTLGTQLTAMAGLRVDHSTLWGTFTTPRLHVKWQPAEAFSLRASIGKGYRSPFVLAENMQLLASGRTLVIDGVEQERAWNYGLTAALNLMVAGKMLKANVEYYYTDFSRQTLVDYDSNSSQILITGLKGGQSYSHTVQVDATYPFFRGFTLTAAYRYNDVKATYGGRLRAKPLTGRYKALLTAAYETPLRKWQFDVTLQLNGGGRLPDAYTLSDGTPSYTDTHYHAYGQLSAQVTREFRTFSVYVGGENLTGLRQKNTVLDASTPWASTFEPTLVWGPVHGAMAYAGIRVKI